MIFFMLLKCSLSKWANLILCPSPYMQACEHNVDWIRMSTLILYITRDSISWYNTALKVISKNY